MFVNMVTTYKLNTKELENTFIDYIRTAYPDQIVEIQVKEQDATEYLLSTPANQERMATAIKNIENGNIITFETLEEAMEAAEQANKR